MLELILENSNAQDEASSSQRCLTLKGWTELWLGGITWLSNLCLISIQLMMNSLPWVCSTDWTQNSEQKSDPWIRLCSQSLNRKQWIDRDLISSGLIRFIFRFVPILYQLSKQKPWVYSSKSDTNSAITSAVATPPRSEKRNKWQASVLYAQPTREIWTS